MVKDDAKQSYAKVAPLPLSVAYSAVYTDLSDACTTGHVYSKSSSQYLGPILLEDVSILHWLLDAPISASMSQCTLLAARSQPGLQLGPEQLQHEACKSIEECPPDCVQNGHLDRPPMVPAHISEL